MSVLRTIESKLESLFEGVFGRAFRTNVQPVELARKLVKEMDDHRTVSVSRVYVPNEYTIYLAPDDREQFADFEDSLRDELADYLAEHARREGYVLLDARRREARDRRRPRHGRLRHRDAARARRTAAAGRARRPRRRRGRRWSTSRSQPTEAAADARAARSCARSRRSRSRARSTRSANGRVVLGRSKDCDIKLDRPQRLAPPRRDPPGGRDLLARRPRLDERRRGERQAREAAQARGRRRASRSARPRSLFSRELA